MASRTFIGTVYMCAALACFAGAATTLGLLPFTNTSSYKGNWDLSLDVPRYVEGDLRKTYTVVPFDTIFAFVKTSKMTPSDLNTPAGKQRIAQKFNIDFLIDATISDFLVRKRVVGEGKYGGLKNYLAHIKATVGVFNRDENGALFRDVIEAEKKETLTAINLGRLSDDEELFLQLNNEAFGSEIFEKSIAGSLMREFCDKMHAAIQRLPAPVYRKNDARTLVKNARIVDIKDADIYINAGSDDQVAVGDIFPVYAPGDSIKDPDTGEFLGVSEKLAGRIRITFVQASHFSRAECIEKTQSFSIKDMVRIEK